MSKIIYLLILVILVSGCTTVCKNNVFKYEPSPLAVTQKIEKTIGFNILIDNLPNEDKKYIKSIPGFSDRITAALLEDIRKSQIFRDIHLGVQPDDDLIINGKVNRFIWGKDNHPSIIPFSPFFGAPVVIAIGLVDISLEIKDNKTKATIGVFRESSEVKQNYYLYYKYRGGVVRDKIQTDLADVFKDRVGRDREQVELTVAFKDVVDKLKEDILTKINSPMVTSNADEIAKYKKLLDSGAITKEEFEQKKKYHLGS